MRMTGNETDIRQLIAGGAKTVDGLGDNLSRLDVENSFYLEPFEAARGHSRALLIHALSPGTMKTREAAEFSRLDEYQKLQQLFGSGLLRDIVNNGEMLQLPTHVQTRMSMYGRHFQLTGIEGLRKAEELDATVFLYERGKNSILNAEDVGGSPYNTKPVGQISKGVETSRDWAQEKVDEQTKEVCD